MSETWYKVRRWYDDVQAVEIDRYTDASVWQGKNRRARNGEFDQFFPTWEEARGVLLDRVTKHITQHRLQLQRLQGVHGNILGMKPPLPAPTGPKP